MKRRPLDKIYVLGVVLNLVADPHLAADESNRGAYSGARGTITIDASMPVDDQGDTVLHEIMEALKDRLELSLEHPVLQALSTCLHQVMRANPELIRRIVEGKAIVEEV